jgi:hypothetical protein
VLVDLLVEEDAHLAGEPRGRADEPRVALEHLGLAGGQRGRRDPRDVDRAGRERRERGQLQAARRYDPDSGVQFWTFAYPRVHGAMLDAIREAMPLPRCR